MTRTKIDGITEEEYFSCSCSDLEHTIRFTNYHFEDEDEKNIISVTLFLTQWRTRISPIAWGDIWYFISHPKDFIDNDFIFHTKDFWERFLEESIYNKLSIALKYVFSNNIKQEIFSSTTFYPEHSQDFIDMLDKIIPDKVEANDKEISTIREHRIDSSYDCYTLCFDYDPDTATCNNCEHISMPEIRTIIYFKSEKNIFKRLRYGIRYMFGYKSRWKGTDCYYIKTSDAIKLQLLFQKVINHYHGI